MSFKDIRASRVSRKPKSYVVSSPNLVESSAATSQDPDLGIQPQADTIQSSTLQGLHREDEQPITNRDQHELSFNTKKEGVSIPRSDLYPELPLPLDVRKTDGAGRGLWTKNGIRAGAHRFLEHLFARDIDDLRSTFVNRDFDHLAPAPGARTLYSPPRLILYVLLCSSDQRWAEEVHKMPECLVLRNCKSLGRCELHGI